MAADDSSELYAADHLKKSDLITAYAKNEHLGFQVYYLWNGARRWYIPDFLIRLVNGKTLVLEIKGEDSEQNQAKGAALATWVKGVNARSGLGFGAGMCHFSRRRFMTLFESIAEDRNQLKG